VQTVRSPDGVVIGYERWGSGHPVVAVHGSDTTHRSWRPFADHLDGFEVCAMDRRGRGASGDGDGYALAREVEDVRAVVTDVAGDSTASSDLDGVALVGHSFGALRHFEREAAGVPDAVLDRIDWGTQVGMADQTRREIAAVGAYRAPDASGIGAPTLCLVGEESPEYLHETTRALADSIPDSRVETLAGQGHLATVTAPGQLADTVSAFLGE
jgi:pimeloyl-ACP methyl ester carboxylesterase